MGTGEAPNYQQSPLAYGYTVGTAVTALVGYNPNRKGLWIHNPNAVALVGVAPSTNTATGGSLVPAINGAGTMMILPSATIVLQGPHCSNNFNGITDTPGANITVWELL